MSKQVLVTQGTSGSSRKYHTDANCRFVTENHEPRDLEEAKLWFDKCYVCDSEPPVALGGMES